MHMRYLDLAPLMITQGSIDLETSMCRIDTRYFKHQYFIRHIFDMEIDKQIIIKYVYKHVSFYTRSSFRLSKRQV